MNWFNMPIERKILNQTLLDKVHICNVHYFHWHILCVDADSICCFIKEFNWSGLPQMSHFKGFFHMVYFLHELIQYAYRKININQILHDKVHIYKVHRFHGHILCTDGEKILVQSYNSFPLWTDCICCFIRHQLKWFTTNVTFQRFLSYGLFPS